MRRFLDDGYEFLKRLEIISFSFSWFFIYKSGIDE